MEERQGRQGRQLNLSPGLSNANKLKEKQKDWLDKSSGNDEKGSRTVNDEISGLIVKIDPPFHDQDQNTKTKTLKKGKTYLYLMVWFTIQQGDNPIQSILIIITHP